MINANSVDPDQMLHVAASDLGQLCLSVTHFGVSQPNWLVMHLHPSMSTHNLCFEQKYEKYQNFLSEKLPFFGGKIFSVFE